MRKKQVVSFVTIWALLFLGLVARGQTSIPISGPSPVCKGNTGVYAITPTAGLTYYWSVSPQGNISTTTSSSATVLWGIAGTGTLKVSGLDSAGDTVQVGTLNVVVAPLPTPYITNNSQVACQTVDSGQDPKGGRTTIEFNDTGCLKVCANSTVVFTANGYAGSTFVWSATGDVSISPSGATCSILWGAAGSGSVTVTETTTSGCTATKTICITIIDHPHAQFYIMPNPGLVTVTVCDSTPLLFIDQSTAGAGSSIIGWRWDFGDGTYSNAQSSVLMPLVHEYNHPGTYVAVLTVTNECGCTDQFKVVVKVQNLTGVRISCPHVVCQNDTGNYTSSVACSAGAWSVVGGTILSSPPVTAGSISVDWNMVDTSGFGYVLYNGAACGGLTCPSVTVIKVPVVLTTGHITGPTIVCAGNQIIYRLPQWPTTKFNWTVTSSTGATIVGMDQPNEIALNTGVTSGTITLSCSYTNTLLGCTGTASVTIQVLPVATINGQSVVCYTSSSTYTLSGGLSGNWVLTFPNGSTQPGTGNSITAVFNQVGNYTLSVTGSTFCPPNVFGIRVDSLPHIPDNITGPTTLCKGVETEFDAGNPVPGTTFAWAALNGSVHSGAGPKTFVELNPGSTGPYAVYVWRETSTAPHCHSDTLKLVVDTPQVNLAISGPTSVCESSTAAYASSYTLGETYTWSVSPAYMGSVQNNGSANATILWNNTPGTATVTLKVTKCFSTYTATYNVTVNPTPTVTLTAPDTICSATAFTACVSYGGVSVTFNWGNGVSNTTTSPCFTYTYPAIGGGITAYTISANITTPCGTIITVSKVVFVKPAPVANITPDGPFSYCPPAPFSQLLTATINSGFEPVVFYTWYNNGTVVSSGATATTYTATGAGMYYLMVTGANGCTNYSDTVFVFSNCGGGGGGCVVTPTPVLTVTAALDTCGYVHTTGAFTGAGVFNNWNYPSQAITAVTTSSTGDFTFNKAGKYYFTYNVNYSGCIYSQMADTIVPYIAGVKYAIACNGSGTTYKVTLFDNSNFYPVTPITNYTLKLNGGTVYSGGTAPTYTTNLAPGTYYVEEDISGSVSTVYPVCHAYATIVVPNPPHASFTMSRSTVCAVDAAVFFTNTSTGSGLTYAWSFGDGATNSEFNPYRVYASAGNYTPTLTVTDVYGCTSTTSLPLTVKPIDLAGFITALPNYPCAGTAVTLLFNSTGTGVPNHYYWMDGLDTFANTIYNSIHVFDPGYYWVTGTDAIGCVVNTGADTVVVTQVPPAIIFGDTSECSGTKFTLNGYAGDVPGLTYTWLLNGAVIGGATSESLTQTLYTPGTYVYKLVLSVPNPGGGFCTDTSAPFNVIVHTPPAPPVLSFTIPNCVTYEVDLLVSPSYPGTYNWSNGSFGPAMITYQGGAYQVTYTDLNGCVSYSSIDVPKDPKVYLWIFPSGCFTLCVPQTLYDITGPIIPFASWQYTNTGGPGASGSGYIPDFTFNNTGQIYLTLNNGYCSATSDTMDVSASGPCQGRDARSATGITNISNTGEQPLLKVIPNPAKNSTTIAYTYTGSNTAGRYLEVYDITGRLVSRYQVADASGSWQLSLDTYAPGMYQVIMRQDNRLILNSKLVVIR